jgi:hypothetical protein
MESKMYFLFALAFIIIFYVSFQQFSQPIHTIPIPTIPIPTIPVYPPNNDVLNLWLSNQNHCNNRTWTVALNLNGGSFPFRCMFACLYYSIVSNRTLFIVHDHVDNFNWTDFFIPITKCPLPPPAISGPNKGFSEERNRNQILDDTANIIFSDIPHIWCYYWGTCFNQLPIGFQFFDYIQLIWQYNLETKTKIEQILSQFPKWNITRFHGFHIRRGDKVFGNAAEARFVPTEKYCQTLENALNTKEIRDPVFVAADSWNSIEEVKKARPEWTVWAVKGFENMRMGNFTHSILTHSSKEVRRLWEFLLLSELIMLRFSHYFIGTGTSNIWQLVNVMRSKDRPKSITID